MKKGGLGEKEKRISWPLCRSTSI